MHKGLTSLMMAVLGVHITLFSALGIAQMPHSLSRDYIRTDFTVEEGLPDNVVNAIAQTENGLLWVGTQTGLATFDGQQFHPIQLRIPNAPSQGAVHSLIVTSSGDLWIGSDAGIVLIPFSRWAQNITTQVTSSTIQKWCVVGRVVSRSLPMGRILVYQRAFGFFRRTYRGSFEWRPAFNHK